MSQHFKDKKIVASALVILFLSGAVFLFLNRGTKGVAEASYDSYTKLLLHMDGDASGQNHAVTFNGDADLDAATTKFNGSLYLDGAGDYLSFPDFDGLHFGSGDFTIDFWAKDNCAASSGLGGVLDSSNREWGFVNNGCATGYQIWFTDGTYIDSDSYISFTSGQWTHWALVRSGTNFYFFKDGILQDTQTSSKTIKTTSYGMILGRIFYNLSNYYFNGYIDEFRISKGIARWTSDFTPPTETYETDEYTKLLLHMDGDVSGQNHSVTFNGDADLDAATTKFNGSLQFDGTGDYLSIPDSADWNFAAENFTIDFWFETTDTGTHYFFQSPYSSSGNGWNYYAAYISSGKAMFYAGTTSASSAVRLKSVSTVNDGNWHHFAVVRNGASWYLYIDGNRESVITKSITITYPTNNFSIGCLWNATSCIVANIDEFRISKGIARWTDNFFSIPAAPYEEAYDGVCGSSDGEYFNAAPAENLCSVGIATAVSGSGPWTWSCEGMGGATDNCSTYNVPAEPAYSLDENTKMLLHFDGTDGGTTFTDEAGHTATVAGGAKINDATSVLGTAAGSFDGAGDYISFADSNDWYFGTSDFTVDMWLNPQTLSDEMPIFGQSTSSGTGNPKNMLMLMADGRICYYDYTQSFEGISSSGAFPNDGVWHHLALVRSSGTLKMYLDGELVSGGTFSYPTSSNNANVFYIGYGRNSSSAAVYFNGFIDEFRISNIARWTSDFVPNGTPPGDDCKSLGGVACNQIVYGDYIINTYRAAYLQTTGGTVSWTPPTGVTEVEYLVVGGGGGGGAANDVASAGGGGAGGFLTGTTSVTPDTPVTIVVGAGGAGAPASTSCSRGTNGGISSFGAVSVLGGGGGACDGYTGNDGASGGGGSGRSGLGTAGGSGTSPQGNNGGSGSSAATYYCSGGGGGFGTLGGSGDGTLAGGGGVGSQSSISGRTLIYSGGGGGGTYYGQYSVAGIGGSGVGGAGGFGYNVGNPAVNNTGSGGGGSGAIDGGVKAGGSGSAGVVIVRYSIFSDMPGATNFSVPSEEDAISGDLSCSVDSSCSGAALFKMFSADGGHAGLAESTFTNFVCCSGISGLGNNCSGNYDTVLRLYSPTDGHVQESTESTFANNACLSSDGGSVSCTYADDSCPSGYECVASIYSSTGGHVGDCDAFPRKVCCSVSNIDNSCWYCEHYFDSENVLHVGKDGQLEMSFDYIDDDEAATLSGYRIAISDTELALGNIDSQADVIVPDSSTWVSGAGVAPGSTITNSEVSVEMSPSSELEQIGYGNGTTPKTYYWWVKVKNDNGIESGWISAGSFKTPKKHYPIVRVVSNKTGTISAGVNIQYCSGADVADEEDPCYSVCWTGTGSPVVDPENTDWKCSVCYDSTNTPVSCSTLNDGYTTYTWKVPSGYAENTDYTLISGTLTSANPVIKFITVGTGLKMGLNITGSECGNEEEMDINISLPTWKEITPF